MCFCYCEFGHLIFTAKNSFHKTESESSIRTSMQSSMYERRYMYERRPYRRWTTLPGVWQESDIFVRAFYLKKPGYLYNMGWISFGMMLLGIVCSFKSSAFHDQITRVFDTRPGTGVTGVTETVGPVSKHHLPSSLRPNSGDVSRPNSGFTRSVSSMSRPKTAKSIFFDMASVLTEEDVGSDFSQ